MNIFLLNYCLVVGNVLYLNNKTIKTMRTFTIGQNYEMNFIGDSKLKPLFTCVKKTAKTVSFESVIGNESFTKRLNENEDGEFVRYASYSMSPVIRS